MACDPSINWTAWAKKPRVQVSDAVLLSMGVDPGNTGHGQPTASKLFAFRLKALMQDASDKHFFPSNSLGTNVQESDLFSLKEFAAWCFERKVPAPPQLLAIGESLAFSRTEKWRRKEGRYTLEEASELLAASNETDAKPMLKKLVAAAANGSLKVYEFGRKAHYLPDDSGDSVHEAMGDLEVYSEDLNEWLELNEPKVIFRFALQKQHLEKAVDISTCTSPGEMVPQPLTTGDISFCFVGLWSKSEQEWKKLLGKQRDWIEACVVTPASGRGRGASPKLWNPVLLGAALVTRELAQSKSVRARFQSKVLLIPWLDAWKTHEADHLSTD